MVSQKLLVGTPCLAPTSLEKETVLSSSKCRCAPSKGVNCYLAPVLSPSHLGDAHHALCPCFCLPLSFTTISHAHLYFSFRSIWNWAPHNGLPDGSLLFEVLKLIAAHLALLILEVALLLGNVMG